jgi:hypothetical protein
VCATLLVAACGGGDDQSDSVADAVEDLLDGDASALDDLDASDLDELLEEITDGALDDLGDGSGLDELFGDNGTLDELLGGGALGELLEEQSGGAVDIDDDGISVESEDGNLSVTSTDELPEGWPAEVPTPDGLDVDTVAVADTTDTVNISVMGSVEGDTIAWIERYGEQLEGAGFEQTTFNRTGDDATGSYRSELYDVVVVSAAFGGDATVTVALTAR